MASSASTTSAKSTSCELLKGLKASYSNIRPQLFKRMENIIHRINLYPLDSANGFPNTYPCSPFVSTRYWHFARWRFDLFVRFISPVLFKAPTTRVISRKIREFFFATLPLNFSAFNSNVQPCYF